MLRFTVITALATTCSNSSSQVEAAVPDALPSDAGIPLAQRISAATATATSNDACTAIAPFYWEIGTAGGALGGGSLPPPLRNTRETAVTADTEMDIASASKWLFGAYVVERYQDDLTQVDLRAMHMASGYVSLSYPSCTTSDIITMDDCLNKDDNGVHTASADDRFDYDGGHFQQYASTALRLGGADGSALADAIAGELGADIGIAYSSPQLAAGAHMSATQYARFLRKILAGQLAISHHLGEAAVCTLPGRRCPTARYSPALPYAWHYSYGHWVEDDAATGDGAFSSPGAFGFYPWIDRSRTYYGVLARQVRDGYRTSAKCGGLIRLAFEHGVAQ